MRWQMGRRSGNVEDRRGMGMTPVVGGGLGAIVLALIAMFLGIDPSIILESGIPQQTPNSGTRQGSPEEEKLVEFVRVVLGDTEDVWTKQFRQMGRQYVEPKLVLFSGSVESACGFAQAAMGPFYCPADQKVYIDLSFYRELQNRHNAPGDFAQAYVLAHEVGHHVQTQLGITQQVNQLRQRVPEAQGNQALVRLELQADCFAGVWANQAQKERNILEQGDIEEALNAASQIGDDRLQSKSRGYVVPDSFTHGTSAQRVRWFTRGIQSGDMNQCNTFATNSL